MHDMIYMYSSKHFNILILIMSYIQWRSRGYCRPGANIYGRPIGVVEIHAARNCRPSKAKLPPLSTTHHPIAPPLHIHNYLDPSSLG